MLPRAARLALFPKQMICSEISFHISFGSGTKHTPAGLSLRFYVATSSGLFTLCIAGQCHDSVTLTLYYLASRFTSHHLLLLLFVVDSHFSFALLVVLTLKCPAGTNKVDLNLNLKCMKLSRGLTRCSLEGKCLINICADEQMLDTTHINSL